MNITRRAALIALAAGAAAPALAQGKKGGGESKGVTDGALIGIDGQYRANGMNADGTRYDGTTWITQQGNAVEFTWEVAGDTLRGQGAIEGRVVTVDWGDATPVVYVVMPDGTLHGTWADGAALEKLTPM